MIKVSVFYPYSDGSPFDIAYYVEKHMPMVKQRVGAACKGAAVGHGLASAVPGAPLMFVAMGHMYFDSVESFRQAFGPHQQAIMADVPNYTKIQPVLQISEVKL